MAEQVAIKPDPALKPDPDAMDDASPMAVDAYEDDVGDLDLEFYNPVEPSGGQSAQDQLFMARVPTYVWAAWDKIDDDTPIEIGKLRVWSEPDKKQGSKVSHPSACLDSTTRFVLKRLTFCLDCSGK